MKIAAPFYARTSSAVTSLGDEGLCVRSLGTRYLLNLKGPSALVWTMADGTHSINEMEVRVARRFEMSRVLAKRAVEESLTQLRKAGMFFPAEWIGRTIRIVNPPGQTAKLRAGHASQKRG